MPFPGRSLALLQIQQSRPESRACPLYRLTVVQKEMRVGLQSLRDVCLVALRSDFFRGLGRGLGPGEIQEANQSVTWGIEKVMGIGFGRAG